MTDAEIKEKYESIETMIHSLAWSMNRKTGIHHDEFFSVGNFAFMEAVQNWNPKKASFSTYFYRHCLGRMLDSIADAPVYYDEGVWDMLEVGDTSLSTLEFNDRVSTSLGNEAKHVINVIISAPTRIHPELGSFAPKKIRGHITRYLKKRGYKPREISSIYAEIKGFLTLAPV
jgi:hypothetical protein